MSRAPVVRASADRAPSPCAALPAPTAVGAGARNRAIPSSRASDAPADCSESSQNINWSSGLSSCEAYRVPAVTAARETSPCR